MFHRSLGDRVARVARARSTGCACSSRSTTDRRPTDADGPTAAVALRGTAAPACRRPSASPPHGDELYIFYTGGTTGMPKGVMYPLREFTEFFVEAYPRHGRPAAARRRPS